MPVIKKVSIPNLQADFSGNYDVLFNGATTDKYLHRWKNPNAYQPPFVYKVNFSRPYNITSMEVINITCSNCGGYTMQADQLTIKCDDQVL